MDIKLFFMKNFNIFVNELNLDLDNNNSYIYYNELVEKKGSRYEYIVSNNLNFNFYNFFISIAIILLPVPFK